MTAVTRSTRPHRSSRWRAPLVATTAALAVLVALASPAWAHVEAAGETNTSGITTVTFSFTHGCAGSPTTELTIQLPEGATEVTPQNPAGWTSTVSTSVLDWKGGQIPDTEKGEFVVSMRAVGTKGTTVFLPTKQICVVGENDWLEKTDDPEADNAAPRIVLTETVASDTTVTTEAPTTTEKKEPSTTKGVTATTSATATGVPTPDDSNNNTGLIVGGIAVLIIVVGAAVLYLQNRRPKTSASGTPESDDIGADGPPNASPPPTSP